MFMGQDYDIFELHAEFLDQLHLWLKVIIRACRWFSLQVGQDNTFADLVSIVEDGIRELCGRKSAT